MFTLLNFNSCTGKIIVSEFETLKHQFGLCYLTKTKSEQIVISQLFQFSKFRMILKRSTEMATVSPNLQIIFSIIISDCSHVKSN